MGTAFISNKLIKAALVARIKSKATITSLLATTSEVRENQYQGTEFLYPSVRTRIISNEPIGNPGCGQNVSLSIMSFSEQASSAQCEEIAGIIATEFHGKQFVSNSLAFAVTVDNLIPAIRIDKRTWRSEVLMTAIITG